MIEDIFCDFSMEETIRTCCCILEKIISSCNVKIKKSGLFSMKNIFESGLAESISLFDYIQRIAEGLRIKPNIIILALMNLDNLLNTNKTLTLTTNNCHRYKFH
jgi:hypothetical protein